MTKRGPGRPAGGTPATTAAAEAGVAFTLHDYPHDPGRREYGAEAVERLGLDPYRVFKTLVARAGGGHVVAVVPVAATLDLKALAAAVGAKHAEMAEGADAERLTGYVLGGISPLGTRRRLRTVVDATATGHPTVFVSAGRRGLEIELAPADLVVVTAATVAPIARH